MKVERIELQPIKTACIGGGIAGQSHIFDLLSREEFELMGVATKSRDSLAKINSSFSLVNKYSTLDEVLNDSSLQLVVIATPNNIAPDLVFKSLQKKFKILIEKPFIIFLTDFYKITSSFPHAETDISILYNRRFKKAWIEAKQVINSNELGQIKNVVFKCQGPYKERFSNMATTFRADKKESVGGVILDTCSHILDSILFLFGEIGTIESSNLIVDYTTQLEYSATIVINQFDKYKISIEILNQSSEVETKSAEISGTNGIISIGDSNAVFSLNNRIWQYEDNYTIRPTEDGINLINNSKISGTRLSEAKFIAEKINSIYQLANFSYKKNWQMPRAKVLAKRSGAC